MVARRRITWHDLPPHLQAWVEGVLGAPVNRVISAEGGYSPGTTDALFADDGRVGFLKAVHPAINPRSPELIRAERHVLDHLPAGAPVAGLIAALDEGPDGWVAILLDYVEGRQAPLPWTDRAIESTLRDLDAFARVMTPNPVAGLSGASTELRHLMLHWPQLARVADLDPWLAARAAALHEAAERALPSTDGDTLTHLDLRADNLLVRPDGSLVIVDWPWAVEGASWVDPALLAIEFISSGDEKVDPDAWIDRIAHTHGVDAGTIVGLLIGILGFFEAVGREPDPPGLPTVRSFQRFQAAALRNWVKASRHTGWLRTS